MASLNTSASTKGSPLPGMMIFELAYKLFVWAVVRPAFRFILVFTLTISGYQLAFNDFIVGFLFTVPGFIAAVVLLLLAAVFTYFEFAVLILLSGHSLNGQRPSVRFLLAETRRAYRNLAHPSSVFFCLYTLGLLPVVGMGFSSSLLPGLSVPNFITGELQKNPWGHYLLVAGVLLLLVLFFGALFTLPIMVLQGQSFGRAFIKSFGFAKKNPKKTWVVYLGVAALWLVLYRAPALLCTTLFGVPDATITKVFAVFGFSWKSFLLAIVLLLLAAVRVVILPVLIHFVVRQYAAAGGKIELAPLGEGQGAWRFTRERLNKLPRPPRPVVVTAGILLLLLLGFGLLRILNNPPGLHEPIVVGHRGSAYGVENTLEALQGAIDAGADYAEVDVLLAADGVPVVVHDSNLNRLAGQNVNVYDLTTEELQGLTLSQNGYTGQIPTLEEVVQYCQGKIGLAVEIKLHGEEQADVVEETIGLLQRYGYLDDCMFLSLEYTLIEDINTRYPEAVAGYCVYGNVGSLRASTLMDMEIDFVVIEESMATSANIFDFRGGWLPVFVWTVNDEANMRQYLDRGAIGIVTDYPDVGREVVDGFLEEAGNSYLEEAEWRE